MRTVESAEPSDQEATRFALAEGTFTVLRSTSMEPLVQMLRSAALERGVPVYIWRRGQVSRRAGAGGGEQLSRVHCSGPRDVLRFVARSTEEDAAVLLVAEGDGAERRAFEHLLRRRRPPRGLGRRTLVVLGNPLEAPEADEPGTAGGAPVLVAVHPGSSTLHVSCFVLVLEAIAGLVGAEAVRERFRWSERLLGVLSGHDTRRSLELRWLFHAGGTRGDQGPAVYLIGRGSGATSAEAEEVARHMWADLEPLVRMGEGVASFRPARSRRDTQDALDAIRPQDGHELLREGRRVRLHPRNRSIGFRHRLVAEEEAPFLLPLQLSTELRDMDDLAAAAQALERPVCLSLVARSFDQEAVALECLDRADRSEEDHVEDEIRVLKRWLATALDLRILVTAESPVPQALLNLAGGRLLGLETAGWRAVRLAEPPSERLLTGLATPRPEAEALATCYSLPEAAARFQPPTPKSARELGLEVLPANHARVPGRLPGEGVVLGQKLVRGRPVEIHLADDDRSRHTYVIGQTGTGKSTLLATMILDDIRAGRGVGVLDPHGDLVDFLLPRIPRERAEDVVLFDPTDGERPIGLNLLESSRPAERDFLIQESILMFYRLFDPNRTGMVGPQWEHWFRNASLLLMLSAEGGTLIDVPALYTDDDFRRRTVAEAAGKDATVRDFWCRQYENTTAYHRSEMLNYFVSKFGRFRSNEALRNIVGQLRSALRPREVMDEGRILLARLSRGELGEMNSGLLGTVLVTRIFSAALARAAMRPEQRRDFCLYVDEFQLFTTETLSQIAAESRKYGLSLCLAHQNLDQLDPKVRQSLLGNVGNLICFRPGVEDAVRIHPYFRDGFSESELLGLPNWQALGRLLIEGRPSQPFLFQTRPDTTPVNESVAEAVREHSRLKFGRARSLVEDEITRRLGW